jgi:4-diphosphocytidyl-2-C-methyl-D-erythritol kinase
MVIFPNAKINIGLRITEKRSDGFHNIETVFYPIKLGDALEFNLPVSPLQEDYLVTSGINTGCSRKDNLISRAVELLRQKYPVPSLNIHLHKAIPLGSGLGGGSSDAASMLKWLNNFFKINLSKDELKSLSAGLGSDCAFFIENTPAFAVGRGEILRPLPLDLTGYQLVLLSPGIHISSKEAFENCIPQKPSDDLEELILKPVAEWKETIVNDFESTIFAKYPLIKSFKELLYNHGAIYCSMSGSGSSVYVIFNKKPVIPEDLKKYVIYSDII